MRIFRGLVAIAVTMSMLAATLAIMPAGAVDVDAPDVNGNINVSVVYPHISGFDLLVGPMNMLNDYVDVNAPYNLTITGWYDYGAAQVDQVDVWMWRDGGATGADLSAAVDAGAPNGGVHFRWALGAFSIVSGITGLDPEWALLPSCGFSATGPSTYRVSFVFVPMSQVWSARGTFTEPTFAGNQRFDPGNNGTNPEDQSDAIAPYAPLNDINTWDIKVVVQDVGKGISDPSWDEFGVYMFSAINTGAWPYAGDVDGAGPANTAGVALPNADNNWVFVSNTQYDLKISIDTNLLLGGVGPANIPTTAIHIQGGNIAAPSAFGLPTVVQYVLGNAAANTGQAPSNAGTTTSISSLGGTPVAWSCDIPAVAMGTYTSTITYALDLDP